MRYWRPVVGYEDRYEVSSDGLVRTLVNGHQFKAGHILTNNPTKAGYVSVRLYKDKKYRRMLVHRLVAIAFICPPPFPKAQVNHKDGVKSNCWVQNLEWVTQTKNMRHAVDTGLHRVLLGEDNSAAKLSNVQAQALLDLKGTVSQRVAAIQFGVSRAQVYRIWNGIQRKQAA